MRPSRWRGTSCGSAAAHSGRATPGIARASADTAVSAARPRSPVRFHVVGIGGTGMSAVARLLMAHGEVSGSDQGRWPLSEGLRAVGATVHETFDASHVAGAD